MTTATAQIVYFSGGLAGAYLAIIGVYKWVSVHTSDKAKHPCSDDVVYSDVCEERGKNNSREHDHLKEGIDAAIARSDEQHVELKRDMRSGFSEIKSLIQGIK